MGRRQVDVAVLEAETRRMEAQNRRTEIRLQREYWKLEQREAKATQELVAQFESAVADSIQREIDFETQWKAQSGKAEALDYDESEHREMQMNAYRLYKRVPWAAGIVDSLVKYVFGQPASITVSLSRADDTWDKWADEHMFDLTLKEWARRTFRMGEGFPRVVGRGTDTEVRFLPELCVRHKSDTTEPTFGITTEPDDVETVISYTVVEAKDPTKIWQTVPAAEVVHTKIRADSDVKRGVTIYEPILRYLPQIGQLMDYRLAMHKIRTAMAEIRKFKGGETRIAAIKTAELKTRGNTTDTSRIQMHKPGTSALLSSAVDVEYKTPNFQAADAQHDLRYFGLALCAGAGLAEFMVTADASNANMASLMVSEGPAVRTIEFWQDYFRPFIKRLVRMILSRITRQDLRRAKIDVQFAPIKHRDFYQEARGFVLLNKAGLVSRRTAQARLGFDPTQEAEYLEEEGNTGEAGTRLSDLDGVDRDSAGDGETVTDEDRTGASPYPTGYQRPSAK